MYACIFVLCGYSGTGSTEKGAELRSLVGRAFVGSTKGAAVSADLVVTDGMKPISEPG